MLVDIRHEDRSNSRTLQEQIKFLAGANGYKSRSMQVHVMFLGVRAAHRPVELVFLLVGGWGGEVKNRVLQRHLKIIHLM